MSDNDDDDGNDGDADDDSPSTEEETWSPVSSRGEQPAPRHAHSAVLHDDAMWVYGGMTDLQERNDFWRFDTGVCVCVLIKLLKLNITVFFSLYIIISIYFSNFDSHTSFRSRLHIQVFWAIYHS